MAFNLGDTQKWKLNAIKKNIVSTEIKNIFLASAKVEKFNRKKWSKFNATVRLVFIK